MAQKKVAEKTPPAKSQDKAKKPTSIPRLQIILSEQTKLGGRLTCSADICQAVARDLVTADREIFMVLHLNNKNQILAKELISTGSLTASTIHPREVFKGAVLNNSARIVCAHNHPSGDPTPSFDDRVVTARLRQAGDLLGVEVLDHIIVGGGSDSGYYSFVDSGTLPGTSAAAGCATAAEAPPSTPCVCRSKSLDLVDDLDDLHAELRLFECLDWNSLNFADAQRGHNVAIRNMARTVKRIEEELYSLCRGPAKGGEDENA